MKRILNIYLEGITIKEMKKKVIFEDSEGFEKICYTKWTAMLIWPEKRCISGRKCTSHKYTLPEKI